MDIKSVGIAVGLGSVVLLGSGIGIKKYCDKKESFAKTGLHSPELIKNSFKDLELINKQCDNAIELKELEFKKLNSLHKAMSNNKNLQKAYQEKTGQNTFDNEEFFNYGAKVMGKLSSDCNEDENAAVKKLKKPYEEYTKVKNTVQQMKQTMSILHSRFNHDLGIIQSVGSAPNGLSKDNSSDKKILKELQKMQRLPIKVIQDRVVSANCLLEEEDASVFKSRLIDFKKSPDRLAEKFIAIQEKKAKEAEETK